MKMKYLATIDHERTLLRGSLCIQSAINHNDVNIIIMCYHNLQRIAGKQKDERYVVGDATDMEHDTEEGPGGDATD